MRKIFFFTIAFILLICLSSKSVFAGTTSFYLYDRPSRNVSGLTDTNANVINTYTYDVFGNVSSKIEARPNTYVYLGEDLDSQAGLIYLRSRYYDPALGRFTSKDLHPGFSIIPQTKNPYPYCNNNPVNLEDPEGKVVPLIVAAVIASAAWGWYNEAMSALKAGGDYADINNAGAIGALSNVAGTLAARVTLNPWLGGAIGGATSSALKQFMLFFAQIMSQGVLFQKATMVFLVIAVIPLAEEVLFRVFLYHFIQEFTNRSAAVIIGGLIFAVGHNMLLFLPYYFIFAVALNILYIKSKSIFPSVILHSLVNLIAVIFILTARSY